MPTPADTVATQEALAAGWEALAATDWERARASFEAAMEREPTAEALEGRSHAAWWLDDAETMFETRERAYRLYRRKGDLRSAGRMATLLGIDYFSFRGEAAIGNGWFRRAHRLLEGLTPVPEHGWLWIWEGQIRLLEDNDPATARRLGHEAAELGRALGDLDIEMTGLGLEGLAAVTAGEISEGMAKLDEATAAAVGGEMSLPIGMGATCCYLIFACERARDFDRAGQWCKRVQELCLQWRWASLFSTCRTHYASVLLSQGAWKEAEAELEAATRELEASRPGKVADGKLPRLDTFTLDPDVETTGIVGRCDQPGLHLGTVPSDTDMPTSQRTRACIPRTMSPWVRGCSSLSHSGLSGRPPRDQPADWPDVVSSSGTEEPITAARKASSASGAARARISSPPSSTVSGTGITTWPSRITATTADSGGSRNS